MPRPKQRTPELRDRVLQVAVSTLNQDGLSGFTTRRVAEQAGTSVPAVYELFQDKSGLLRAVFFEGFRMLSRRLLAVPETDDAVADVQRLIPVFRRFCLDYPALARVMFSRPFQDFDPGPEELALAVGARDLRRQNQAVHRCRTAHRRPRRYRARIARSGTRFGGSGRWPLAGQVEGVGEPALGGWGDRDSAGLCALKLRPGDDSAPGGLWPQLVWLDEDSPRVAD